ncbi:hypothetical protein PG997_013681 [Apiospora hydei]|uniref:Uncharacterized protein n=1 Tax=Apiospora hydei TaxID=1337664 RepID=A0ABR1VA63_9PEZI
MQVQGSLCDGARTLQFAKPFKIDSRTSASTDRVIRMEQTHEFHLGGEDNGMIVTYIPVGLQPGKNIGLLKDHSIRYTLVCLCGVAASKSSPDNIAACVVGIHPSHCLDAKDAKTIAHDILQLFLPHAEGERITVQLSKADPLPYNQQVRRNYCAADRATPELFPGASVSGQGASGTLSFITTIEGPGSGLKGNGCRIAAISAHVGNPCFMEETSPPTGQDVLSPSALLSEATNSYHGRARVVGHTIVPSSHIGSTTQCNGTSTRQDVVLVEIDSGQPQHKPVSWTLRNHMTIHHEPGSFEPHDVVMLGAASGVSTGTLSSTKANIALYCGAELVVETTECVMISDEGHAPTYGDSDALIYNAAELQNNLEGDIPSVAAGILWGGNAQKHPGGGSKDQTNVQLRLTSFEVNIGLLSFYTELDAVLGGVVAPYLDGMYGRGQYSLNWSCGPSAGRSGGNVGSGGAADSSVSDMHDVTHALANLGV